jgi:hypothetical protein
VVEAQLRAVVHHLPAPLQKRAPVSQSEPKIDAPRGSESGEHLRCAMRPPAPRPESKSVTATPRAARSEAHTAPVTAIGGKGGRPNQEFSGGCVLRGGSIDLGRLLPPPMTATLAAAALIVPARRPCRSWGRKCGAAVGDRNGGLFCDGFVFFFSDDSIWCCDGD